MNMFQGGIMWEHEADALETPFPEFCLPPSLKGLSLVLIFGKNCLVDHQFILWCHYILTLRRNRRNSTLTAALSTI